MYICAYILHSLFHNGVGPGFTDEQISHLDDHNTCEESCVAGKLYDLSALVRLGEKS